MKNLTINKTKCARRCNPLEEGIASRGEMMILSITTSGYWVLESPSLGSPLQEPKSQKLLG